MSNAGSTVGASLQGEFEEMGSFRLAVAKCSLVHGIPYIEAFFYQLLKPIQEQLQASNVVKTTHFFLASCVPELRKKRFLIVCL
jgi:hypothetical protein